MMPRIKKGSLVDSCECSFFNVINILILKYNYRLEEGQKTHFIFIIYQDILKRN